MMRFILFVLFVCFLQSAIATTYYFSSSSGDDSRTSTEARNSSTPWKSLSKLNSFFSSLQPGDNVLLKRGETFYGSIIVNKSGTSGSPIFIGAYGSGNKPLITSLVTLSGWVSKGGGIWEGTNSSLSSTVSMVLMNGVEQELGRYPNSNATNKGYLMYETHVGTSSITDKQLSSSPNWTGATVVMRSRRWILDRNVVTSHSGNKISYKATTSYAPYDNNGYFFQNSIKTLDKLGEWYYSGSSQKLSVYFGSNSPSSYNVQAATKDNLIFSEKFKYIVFDNLNIEGSAESCVHIKSGSDISIESCDIQFSGLNGVDAKFHDNFKIENSTVSNSNNNGINLGYTGNNAVVRNNVISNTSTFAGMGSSGDDNGLGLLSSGDNSVIEYNKIINTGYIALKFTGSYVTISNNLIDGFCLTKDDGSGIYTYIGSSAAKVGRKVTNNIILNGKGAPEGTSNVTYSAAEGIYADNNASNVEVSGNTVANCINQGIYVHSSYAINILNNTMYNNNNRQLSMIENTDNSKIRNCKITNNIIFSKSSTQKLLYFVSPYDDIPQFGKFSGNYYARPSDSKNNEFLDKIHVVESGAKLITFSQDVRFEYNATKSSKTVSLDASYVDVKNNRYSGSVTLQPFTSVVLIKNGPSTTGKYPTVNITSPSQNTNFTAGATINISANASDADGTIKKVDFYNGSTLLGTKTTSPYTFAWKNVSTGDYTLTAQATDNSGNVTTSDGVSISVTSSSSSNPTVSLTSPTQNASYKTGATINISANASDADGTIKKVDFYNGSTLLGTKTTSPYTFAWEGVSAGNYTLTARATDNSGNVTTSNGVSISVTSSSSSNPTVSLTSPTQNASYKTGATINISANASDAGGSITKVEFYSGSALLHTETTSPYTWDWKNVGAGNYTITAKATDNSGNATTSAGVSISVTSASSSNPQVSLTSPTQNASYKPGATVTISADASDAGGSITKVEFYNGSALLHTETTTPYIWDWKNVSVGNYTITAKATDNSGNTATSAGVSISVTSSSSSNPIVSLTSPTQNASYKPGATVTISANASDAGGSITKVEFYNSSTLLHTETTIPYIWDWKNVSAGNYTIIAKATDNSGNTTTSASVSISVSSSSSSNPIVSLTSPTQNASYKSGSTININANASDAGGSIKTVQFYSGSTLLHTETGSPYNWDWKNVKAGNYTITAVATDNSGNTTISSSVSISVVSSIVNSRPLVNNTTAEKTMSDKANDLPLDFGLYPNPSVNTIKINLNQFQSNQKANLSVENMSGSILKSLPIILSGKTIDVDISSLSPGIYVMQLKGDSFVINKKFVKMN